jgi:hypothetical protein
MPSAPELKKLTKDELFDLKKLERDNAGYDVKGLKDLIIKKEAGMDEEDVAYVEKKIAQLD